VKTTQSTALAKLAILVSEGVTARSQCEVEAQEGQRGEESTARYAEVGQERVSVSNRGTQTGISDEDGRNDEQARADGLDDYPRTKKTAALVRADPGNQHMHDHQDQEHAETYLAPGHRKQLTREETPWPFGEIEVQGLRKVPSRMLSRYGVHYGEPF